MAFRPRADQGTDVRVEHGFRSLPATAEGESPGIEKEERRKSNTGWRNEPRAILRGCVIYPDECKIAHPAALPLPPPPSLLLAETLS